ncbi:uncharacterized protein [Parasteatoda tepidariorum]|uniref:uncharacterized protein n=1 Tax=Parasteatoda tepidariorum TaxID=114398 RepID=UPI001C72845A|nr:uncharacterized protein LOC107448772 isoform X2 [Parasteatoda tepidariorum]
MESQFINYAVLPIPTLKNVAIVQIVTSLLAQPDIEMELKKMVKEVQDTERMQHVVGYYNFSEIGNIILHKLTLLCIPKKLHQEILDFVKPIGMHMIRCFDLRKWEHYYLYNSISKKTFHWTSWGTIDKIRTLEQAVFDNSSEIDSESQETLFEFACHYCLENCIFELWNRMTKNQKEKLCSEGATTFKLSRLYLDSNLISYWVSLLENKLTSFCERHEFGRRKHSIPLNMLMLAISSKSFLAVKYFWNKLERKKRKDYYILYWLDVGVKEYRRGEWHGSGYIRWYDCQVPNECTDIVLFLMSQLSDQKQQKKAINSYSQIILKSLFNHWPYSVYFLPTINQMWDYIGENLHKEMIITIVTDAENTSRDLLRELWDITPENIKDRFIRSCTNRPDLLDMLT